MSEQPSCLTCEWGDIDPVSQRGKCRINPPQVLMGHTAIQAVWPNVNGQDWCGAHSALNTILQEGE